MPPQITKSEFASALVDLGHRPEDYVGQRLSLQGMEELYGLEQDVIVEAISRQHIDAHYDYRNDTIWVDALEAAHFFYCVRSEAEFYSPNIRAS